MLRFAPPGGMLPFLLFRQPLHLHAAGHQLAGQAEIAVVVLAVHADRICFGHSLKLDHAPVDGFCGKARVEHGRHPQVLGPLGGQLRLLGDDTGRVLPGHFGLPVG